MTLNDHKKFFKEFVKKYVAYNERAYTIKVSHTGHVLRIITHLGKSLNLNSDQLFWAQLIALYHDLGRFIQYEQYRTFNDAISINHAELSVNLLDQFAVLNYLPSHAQSIIKSSIIEHNKKSIDNRLSVEEKYFSMLIRDADKLSNFPFFIRNYDDFNVSKNDFYREDFVRHILSKTPIDNSNLNCIEDYYLYHLSWFNDLNHRESIDLSRKRGYVKNIISRIEDLEVNRKLTAHFSSQKLLTFKHGTPSLPQV